MIRQSLTFCAIGPSPGTRLHVVQFRPFPQVFFLPRHQLLVTDFEGEFARANVDGAPPVIVVGGGWAWWGRRGRGGKSGGGGGVGGGWG